VNESNDFIPRKLKVKEMKEELSSERLEIKKKKEELMMMIGKEEGNKMEIMKQ
jgi:hypothetical protein